jgi:CMP-N-acetylneuraminic acid synthetase
VVRRDVLTGPDADRFGRDVRPYVRKRGHLVNIDEEADLEWAEWLLATGRVG